ncbi:MAG: tetratricopeptide repeat protein [Bacteroidales bacterium]|nr:tetratricopeptide repeat protein [Bacteroidales bacterium]MBN2758009.1 tetratricopeptide repeat protein [Bacteroidales bacterium]
MNENYENIEDNAKAFVERFDDMLKSKNQYFFDVYEFENIIDYYLFKSDYKKAQKVVDYALKMHPLAFSIMIKQAQLFIRLSQPIKALKLLKKLTKIESTNSNLFFLKGVVFCSLGDIKNALNDFNHSLSVTYELKEDLLYNIAVALQEVGRYEFAVDYFLQAYKIDKEDITVIYELAFCYEKLDKDNLSINFYKEYLNKHPFSELAWFNIGTVYNKVEDYSLAIEAFDYAIAIDDEYALAYFNKAESLAFNEQFEESIEVFNEFLEISPDNAVAIFHIGESYAKLKNNEKALEFFDKAIELDNKFADAYYAKSYILYENKNFLDALHSIKKAIKLDSEDDEYWYLSGLINRELNFIEEADKSFKNAIDLNYSDVQIWIEYSKLNFGTKHIYKTINILSEAFEYYKDNVEINYRLAGYLAKIENFSSAAFHLKLALNIDFLRISIFREVYNKKNEMLENLIEQFNL